MSDPIKTGVDWEKMIDALGGIDKIFGPSYSVRRIEKWLKERNLLEYSLVRNNISRGLTKTGIVLKLNDCYQLSIQTDPTIANSSFAESALLRRDTQKLIYIAKIGYWDVIRHDEPENLFKHIEEMKEIFNHDGELFTEEKSKMPCGLGEDDQDDKDDEDGKNNTAEENSDKEIKQDEYKTVTSKKERKRLRAMKSVI